MLFVCFFVFHFRSPRHVAQCTVSPASAALIKAMLPSARCRHRVPHRAMLPSARCRYQGATPSNVDPCIVTECHSESCCPVHGVITECHTEPCFPVCRNRVPHRAMLHGVLTEFHTETCCTVCSPSATQVPRARDVIPWQQTHWNIFLIGTAAFGRGKINNY